MKIEEYKKLVNLKDYIKEFNEVKKIGSNVLLSFSTLFKWYFKLKLGKVPQFLLEQSAYQGKKIMINLQNKDFNDLETRELLMSFLKELKSKDIKILDTEKHFATQFINCYIDVVGLDKDNNIRLIEIKTRNSHKVEITDCLQLVWYSRVLGVKTQGYVATFNKKDNSVMLHPVNPEDYTEEFETINKLFDILGLKNYKI